MKKKTTLLVSMATRVVERMMDHDIDEWPPKCAIALYQPIRPTVREKAKKDESNKDKATL